MNYSEYGQAYTTEAELCDVLYKDPGVDMSCFMVEDPSEYNRARIETYSDLPALEKYVPQIWNSIEEFDAEQQQHWYMPNEYKTLDIAQWVLDKCDNESKLQRVGQELLLYQERNLFDLLRYLKYFVDTMRQNKVVWGLGRGSSVASYVLYIIGVHKVDSIYFDLPIEEFLK
jgi:DNA polymerase III alpha subunit